jgi:hypothetical protein
MVVDTPGFDSQMLVKGAPSETRDVEPFGGVITPPT